jgi:hypothetical protein
MFLKNIDSNKSGNSECRFEIYPLAMYTYVQGMLKLEKMWEEIREETL